MSLYFSFFFSSRRRHTRSLCDWSSDVCSSDLRRHLSQERHVLRRVVPAIDADERGRLEIMRRLLEDFAAAGGDQRLARIEMARRLVEHAPAIDVLLDEEEAPAALDHGRDRDRGLPEAHAALRVFLQMKSAMRATPASIACFDAA